MAIDVSSVVSGFQLVVSAVALVGLAWLTVDVAVAGIRYVRSFFGFSPSDKADAAFWDKYNAGEAVEGVDFVTEGAPLGPHYVSPSEYANSYPDSAQSLPDADPYGGAIDIDPYDSAYDFDPSSLSDSQRRQVDTHVWDGADNVSDEVRSSSPPLDLSVKLGGGWK